MCQIELTLYKHYSIRMKMQGKIARQRLQAHAALRKEAPLHASFCETAVRLFRQAVVLGVIDLRQSLYRNAEMLHASAAQTPRMEVKLPLQERAA